jgi:hypothetical protein
MTATFARWTPRAAGVAFAITLAGGLTGCSTGNRAADTAVPAPSSPSVPPGDVPGVRVLLRVGVHTVTATLADTPQTRQLAAMLPLIVQLKDVWGRAKSGQLPRQLAVGAATPVHDPSPGGIYFWPLTDAIAIYYDDIGQTVPDPGLVRLGVVDTGLDYLADAGRRFTVQIGLDAATGP